MTRIRPIAAALAALAFATGALADPATPTLTDPVAPLAATTGDTTETSVALATPTTTKTPWLIFSLRGGGNTAPAYFGSDENIVWHDWHLRVEYLRFGKHRILGQPDRTFGETYGFRLRHDFQLINGRDPTNYPELSGTYLLNPSIEVGLGASYSQRKYEIYADARYGLFGHKSWSGEIGGNYRMYPTRSLEMWIGPRFGFGSNSYADKWFGIDATESFYSGLPVYDPSAGLLRMGVEIGANLDIHELWDFEAAFTYDRLVNGAADSPITQMGNEDQLAGRIGFVRRFTWR